MPRRLASEACLQLLMSFEGYRRSAARLADGRWTIGYGHTKSAREGAQVSRAEARALLFYDLIEISNALEAMIFTPLNQHQFDALAAFAFNIGLENFRRSVVLQRVNEGALLQAACAIEQWRKAEFEGRTLVVDGLVRRRSMEKTLFLTPAQGWPVVPTPVVQPRLDLDHEQLAPIDNPVEVRVDLNGRLARAEWILPAVGEASAAATTEAGIAAEPGEEKPEVLAPFPNSHADLFPAPVFGSPVEAAPLPERSPWILEPVAAAAPTESGVAAAAVHDRATERQSPVRARFGDFEFATVEPDQASFGPMIALGFFGLTVFAVAIFWALNTHGPAGPFSPQVIGALAALAGVACVVSAVYSLVRHFLGRED